MQKVRKKQGYKSQFIKKAENWNLCKQSGGLKMRILEYGNTNNPTIMLVHGFESPYQIWIDYIEHYKENYHILVPILPGRDVQEKSELNSFDDTAKEIENYCII